MSDTPRVTDAPVNDVPVDVHDTYYHARSLGVEHYYAWLEQVFDLAAKLNPGVMAQATKLTRAIIDAEIEGQRLKGNAYPYVDWR